MNDAREPGSGYFLYHSIGHYPGKAQAMSRALAEFAERWGANDDGQWPYALSLKERFLDAWRRLVGAPAGSLAVCESVTAGLYHLLAALPPERLRGRTLLVAADCFPSLHFLLAGLQERLGFRLETVPLRAGEAWVRDEDVIARWDDRVGVALLTFVTSTASHRCDLAALAAHGRARGTLVGVDVTQGIGILPFDVTAPAVDFMLSTSLKWLCGAPGAGVLYLRPDLVEGCRPELRGWFSQENPFSWDLDAFAYAPDMRRFDAGTPSILSVAASVPALEWRLGQPLEALRAHNLALVERIVAGLDACGLPLASPRDADRRGGSVMARLPDAETAARAVAALREDAVHVDARGAVLRLSPGPVTTAEGVDRLIVGLSRVA